MPDLHFKPATTADANMLADIRTDAMRPSLTALNRIDPIRVRERFLSTFNASDTPLIMYRNQCAGFFVLRHNPDHIYLDHLYLSPSVQGLGLGGAVIKSIQQTATQPIRLMALKDSPANAFYKSQGFKFMRATEYDNHYEWDAPHRGA